MSRRRTQRHDATSRKTLVSWQSLVSCQSLVSRQTLVSFLVLLVTCVMVTPVTAVIQRGVEGTDTDEAEGITFLQRYDVTASYLCNQFMEASWEYNTNVTGHNRREMVSRQLQWSEFHRSSWDEGRQFAWKGFSHASVRRMFRYITVLGRSALPSDKLNEYAELLQQMKEVYSTARVCRYRPPEGGLGEELQSLDEGLQEVEDYDVEVEANRTCLPTLTLEPDLTRVFATSRSPRQLRHAWRAWRDAAGAPIRPLYDRFVDLANEVATLNGFSDAGEYWQSEYEVGDLEGDLDSLWGEVRPLYLLLHAHVRRYLRSEHGGIVPATGPIPGHLLGNMWAQDWSAIAKLSLPYPDRSPDDVTAEMRSQGYNPIKMFRHADNFYRSLGLEAAPSSFWRESLFSRPSNREVVCHASAWDMCNRRDYRVKMCSDVTMEDLIKAHHEMGHIQYDMLYRGQPFIFRDGANPGFHEAVGDVVALSASTPQHLRALGLLPSSRVSDAQHAREAAINHLYGVAMTKIAFLPFALVIDKWRWRVFNGEIPRSDMNAAWWELRMTHSGVAPPVKRTENDFDPGAKYHVPANTPYVRYLVSFVLQFQLHEQLCEASGHTGPLHTCSIYGSHQAGELLRRGLSLGRSEPWPSVLSQLTGGQYTRLDAGPILRYFAPLREWLEEANEGGHLGWYPSEALVAGQVSAYSAGSTAAAYVILSLLLLALILITGCLLVKKWRKAKDDKEETSAGSSS